MQNSILLSLQNTQRQIDRSVLRLATGLKVNSALDNPQNFFTAGALNNRAADLTKRLDDINTSVQTLQQSLNGTTAIERLLDQGEAIAQEELRKLRASDEPPPPPLSPVTPLSTQISNQNPQAYWRLNDLSGNAANQGTIGGAVDGAYLNSPTRGTAPLYSDGDVSVEFNGTDQGVAIPDHPQINGNTHTRRTVELVFNADTTSGRQVLYEEGAAVNALSIYILDGRLHVTGRDQGAWGPPDISVPIDAGETYHVAFTFDSVAGNFIGYVNGQEIGRTSVPADFPSHSGDIGIGFMNQSNWFHDGVQSGTDFYFNGRISDVALYNQALGAGVIESHADSVTGPSPVPDAENEDFNEVMNEITQIARDSGYRGLNLLTNNDLITRFNEDGDHKLETQGVNFTAEGLDVEREGFNRITRLEEIIESVRQAHEHVRRYTENLQNDLSIIQTREDFTQGLVGHLENGADKLTVADINEEGANLLASQTRQQIAFSTLAFDQPSILDVFA